MRARHLLPSIASSLLLVGAGCSFGVTGNVNGPVQQACTMEAKICPDGSSVGRTGPNCEFAPCPGPQVEVDVEGGAGY